MNARNQKLISNNKLIKVNNFLNNFNLHKKKKQFLMILMKIFERKFINLKIELNFTINLNNKMENHNSKNFNIYNLDKVDLVQIYHKLFEKIN